MSLVSKGWYCTVTLTDQGGKKSTMRFDISDALDAAAAATAAAAIVTRLDAITTAAITAYSWGEAYEENAVYQGTGNVAEYALIVARLDSTQEKWANLKIPAPDVGIFQGTAGVAYNTVDANDASLLTYLGSFESGGYARVSDGELLADTATPGNVKGKRITRNSNPQL